MSYSGLLQQGDLSMETYFRQLTENSRAFSQEKYHLKHLIHSPNRFDNFSLTLNLDDTNSFFYDFSKQRLDGRTLTVLHQMAKTTGALQRFSDMARGETVNVTENRPALHTAARSTEDHNLVVDETCNAFHVCQEILEVKKQLKQFCKGIRTGKITGSTGKTFTHAVVVGIGGSYLGCEFVYNAISKASSDGSDDRDEQNLELLFLSNVDIDLYAGIIEKIDPETTLWIVISKSYTTTETMANLNQVVSYIRAHNLDASGHVVTVTAKGSPGDDPDQPVLERFHMFDSIGGRYSVSSAVGGLPLGLALGWNQFERFLKGCRIMDEHTLMAPPENNIPLTAALISIWNTLFLKYPAQAIVPYASRLSKLAPHVQQLYMESIGKSVSAQGAPLIHPTGTIIFGEPGTNAQHSFFQLAHQGPAFPIDFVGVLHPGFLGTQSISNGVTNHQELWSNLLAQTKALAEGRDHPNPARRFEGNRPSSILTLTNLEPESVGMLLSFFEARTVLEGFILGINPFDQFGVELGKTMAGDLRRRMASENKKEAHCFEDLDPSEHYYLDQLFDAPSV